MRNETRSILGVALGAMVFAGAVVAFAGPQDAAAPAKPPLVTVNGKAISQELFDAYAQALAGKPPSDVLKLKHLWERHRWLHRIVHLFVFEQRVQIIYNSKSISARESMPAAP